MSAADTKIPKLMLPLAFAFTVPMAAIAASTNFESLIEFGTSIYGSTLAFSLPAATVGYEIFASIIYFTMPEGLPKIRSSAAKGAVIGLAATIILAVLWLFVDGGVLPNGLWLKVIMKPVPSLITAGFIHVLVLIWKASKASKAAAAAPREARVEVVLPPAGPSPEELAAMVTAMVTNAVAAQVEAALSTATAKLAADVAAMLPKTPPAPRRTVSRSAPAAAAKLAAAPISEPAAEPEATADEDELAALEAQLAAMDAIKPPTTRVSEMHITKARQLRADMRAAGGDPDHKQTGLKSGQLMHEFGLADRTMRAVLEWAAYRDAMELVAA